MTLKQIAENLAAELGPSHKILSSYVVKQTPRRTMPLLQLVELYVKVLGEQRFVENFYDADALYKEHGGFLQRSAQCDGSVTISYGLFYHDNVIAQGQI